MNPEENHDCADIDMREVVEPEIGPTIDPAASDVLEPVKKDEVVLCINCGRQVKLGRVLCRKCSPSPLEHYLQNYTQNCFGPSVIILSCFAGIVTLIVKALT